MFKICKKRKTKKSSKSLLESIQPKTIEQLKAEEVIIAQYQKEFTFEERYNDSQECKKKHPECVPLIIERHPDHKDIKEMQTPKFLFHCQSQTANAMVRTQKDVQAKKMWFFVHMPDNQLKLIYPQSKLGVLYQRYKRSDGNLYIFYSDKNLVQQTSTFMNVLQIICVILLIFYGYVYFFGIKDILWLFGYDLAKLQQEYIQSQTNSTLSNSTFGNATFSNTTNQNAEKIEL
ncbi:hypothetical protein ABPG74_004604 [Tetrahymena malaccensis]